MTLLALQIDTDRSRFRGKQVKRMFFLHSRLAKSYKSDSCANLSRQPVQGGKTFTQNHVRYNYVTHCECFTFNHIGLYQIQYFKHLTIYIILHLTIASAIIKEDLSPHFS